MIAAILRAQFLSMRRMGLGHGGRALLSAIPLVFFYGMWTLLALATFAICRELRPAPNLGRFFSGAFLVIFLYWQIAPVITSSMGASLDIKKLAPYPVPLDKLFIVEVLLRLLTVIEMPLVLAGGILGISRNPELGGIAAFTRLTIASVAFVLFNIVVAAGVRSSIEGFFKRKHARQIGMLVFVLLAVLPSRLLTANLPFEKIVPYLPLYPLFPWGALATMWVAMGTSWAPLVQTGWIGIGYVWARQRFIGTLRNDPYRGHTPRTESQANKSWTDGLFRLPGQVWRDPLGAMVEKELRSLSRSAGFRLTFVMGFTFGLLIFLPSGLRHTPKSSFMSVNFLTIVSLYSLMLLGSFTFWNSFGYDRSAVQFYFAAPVSFRAVLIGKNLAASVAQLIEFALISTMALIFRLRVGWISFSEAVVVTAAASLFLFAFGNMTSVRFASPLDPEKMSNSSAARGKALMSMLVLPIAFLPIGLAYWARYLFRSEVVFFGLLGLSIAIGAILYWIGLDSAIGMSRSRREEMIASLSRGEGPLSLT